ncbi:OmpA family protein [Chelatococcus reniformis]|uniref:Membrane protein n=1 Tax=Chelatococcus reniformis TaxID=1494448 RepID=A0A916XEV0_9HYPH|nr:OmpA family protein [Chelatococcus reniformis]GGC66749.1 membrane protein [Chelatococcus reniformis]
MRIGKWAAKAALLTAALLLAGCASEAVRGPVGPSPNVTNAPVGSGADVPPGSNEDFIVNVGRRVYFKEGSAELDDTARVTLDNQAAWLAKFPRWNAKIQGFADDPGSDEQNRALGLRRADAVKAYLSAHGVAPGRLRAKTYGREKERIVRDCADISCKAQNRRVITNLEGDRDL